MWFFLAFLTAVFTSVKDVIGKKLLRDVDVYIVAWAWPAFTLPFLYGALLFDGVPILGSLFWPAVFLTVAILVAATLLFFHAIRDEDLSLTVPMLAFTPLFLLVTSPLILKEFPSLFGILGIVLIVTGSYVLHFKDKRDGVLGPFRDILRKKGPQFMLLVALLYSVGANIDKIGIRNSSPVMWLVAIDTLLAVVLTAVMKKYSRNIIQSLRANFEPMLLMGFVTFIAVMAQMYAIRLTLVPYVIAIKRTSTIITAFLGFFIFKEGGIRQRSFGIVLMIIGVFLILFSTG